MTPRLASGVLVSALIRRVEASGGFATILAKGDADAGAVLLVLSERGAPPRVLERVPALSGGQRWLAAGTPDLSEPGALTDWLARRRRSDPDLWAVELDVAEAERIAGELLG